ncbi:MAG: TonB-dependent receptor [Vicingaceae bacterium]
MVEILKYKKLQCLLIILLLPVVLLGQVNGTIKGVIKDENNNNIPFVNVGLKGTKKGTAADENGKFVLSNIQPGDYVLQFSAVGYEQLSKSIELKAGRTLNLQIIMKSTAAQLKQVVVTATLQEVERKESPIPVEVFKPAFFKKNPTPAIFESLDMVNGVRPQLNCNVCNTGDIHINGMEGPYTMITIDGMPIVGGLSTVYGLNGIPNSLVERMEIVKGPSSTLYGSEAVGGIINIITKPVYDNLKYSLDVFGTSWQEFNTDLGINFKLNENTGAMLGINYFNYTNPIDNNGDNFTDVTLQNRLSIFNKWQFKGKNNQNTSVAFRYVYEDRWGGEMQWTPEFRGTDSIYGENIITNRFEALGNHQFSKQTPLVYSFSYSFHEQNSYYGTTPYMATQQIAYNQLTFPLIINKNNLLLGTSFKYTYFDDNTFATLQTVDSKQINKPEHIYLPGIFMQDEIKWNAKHKTLVGIRLDYDNRHKEILSPRFGYKFSPNANNIFRVSLGTGYRVVNIFTEDHAALTGAREVIIKEKIKPETSYNITLNYEKFIPSKIGNISFDFSLFSTYFTNKIIPDYETDDDLIIYDNLNGYAFYNGGSANLDIVFNIPFKIRLGITKLLPNIYENDAQGNIVVSQPLLTEKTSGTFALTYLLDKYNLTFDYTGSFYGSMKLPVLENDFRPEYSKPYTIQNIQITKKFNNKFETYFGIKNLLDFTPPKYSIMRPHDPFDKKVNDPIDNPNGYTFDPAYVYAPNQGIRFFLGFRYNVFRKNN